MRTSARDTGLVLVVVAVIGLLLSFAAHAEEPDEPVALDVGDGVVCRVPGVSQDVPLPPGKLLPLPVWSRLDTQVAVLQRELARAQAERVESERQFDDAIVKVAGGTFVVGAMLGFILGQTWKH